MDNLFMIIPAYNEEKNILQVLEEWYPVIRRHHGGGSSRLVVVDDGSTDRTVSIVEKFRERHQMVTCLRKPHGGQGSAICMGYRYALSCRAEYIFQVNSDRQTMARDFEPFWNNRKVFCAVMGFRKGQPGRMPVEEMERQVVRKAFGIDLPDANVPYRLMHGRELRENLYILHGDEELANLLLAVVYAKRGQSTLYLPVGVRPVVRNSRRIYNQQQLMQTGKEALHTLRPKNAVLEKNIDAFEMKVQQVRWMRRENLVQANTKTEIAMELSASEADNSRGILRASGKNGSTARGKISGRKSKLRKRRLKKRFLSMDRDKAARLAEKAEAKAEPKAQVRTGLLGKPAAKKAEMPEEERRSREQQVWVRRK